MLLHTPQHRSTRNIKYLNQPIFTTSDNKFPILPELSTSGGILEPRYCFHHLPRLRCVDQYSRGRGDGIAVWLGGAKVDMGDRRRMFDE